MMDDHRDARLRDALPPALSVPPSVRERMVAAILAEPGYQGQSGNELAERRRRPSKIHWLFGVAAAVTLLLAVGIGVSGPQVNTPDYEGSRPIAGDSPSLAERADTAGDAGGDAGGDSAGDAGGDASVAGSASIPRGSAMPKAPQAGSDADSGPVVTLTAANIGEQVRQLLSAASTQPRSQTALSEQCAAVIGESQVPTLTAPVEFEGTTGLLVVFRQTATYSVWVLESHCASVDSILYYSRLSTSSAQ